MQSPSTLDLHVKRFFQSRRRRGSPCQVKRSRPNLTTLSGRRTLQVSLQGFMTGERSRHENKLNVMYAWTVSNTGMIHSLITIKSRVVSITKAPFSFKHRCENVWSIPPVRCNSNLRPVRIRLTACSRVRGRERPFPIWSLRSSISLELAGERREIIRVVLYRDLGYSASDNK